MFKNMDNDIHSSIVIIVKKKAESNKVYGVSLLDWIMIPSNSYVEVLTPSILECDSIWKKGL